MVESLGLTPVRNPKPKEHAQQKINVNLETQLQYARNGHAVLKGFLDILKFRDNNMNLKDYAGGASERESNSISSFVWAICKLIRDSIYWCYKYMRYDCNISTANHECINYVQGSK